MLGLLGPGQAGFHQEGVDAAEAQPPEHSPGEGASALARHQNVGTGGAFRKTQVAVFFDDELAAYGNHEKHAQPSAKQGQGKDAPEGELFAKAEKDQRGNGEHHAGGERFARRAGGLHDVVLKNGGAPESAKNADRKHRDGDGSGNGEAGTETDVDGNGAEQQPEQCSENDGAESEFGERFFGRDVGAKFARRGRGTPGTIAHKGLLSEAASGQIGKKVRRDYAAGRVRWEAVSGLRPVTTSQSPKRMTVRSACTGVLLTADRREGKFTKR